MALITAPASGILLFDLTVTDGIDTSSDIVQVSIVENNAPIADAGPDVTAAGIFADLLRLASYVGATL